MSWGKPDERFPSVWATLLVYAVLGFLLPGALIAVVFAIWLYRRGVRPRSLDLASLSRLEVFRMLGIGIALACFSGGIRIVTVCAVSSVAPDLLGPWLLGGLPNELTVFRPPPIYALALTGLDAVLLVPALEELVFRGRAFRAWNRSWGFLRAAFASSALFAVIHYDTALIGPFVFGLVACKVYQDSGNLLSPLLVHITHNLVSVSTGFAALASGVSTIPDATMLAWDLLPIGIAALGAGGGFSLWIFLRGIRSHNSEAGV